MSAPAHHETAKRPYEVYRLGTGQELAEICGYVAMKAVRYPGCEVRRTDYPPAHAPRLSVFSPTDLKGTTAYLPNNLLKVPEVQETILEEVPSLRDEFPVTVAKIHRYTPRNRKHTLISLELSDEDNERFIREQFEVRRSIGRFIDLDDYDIAKTAVYKPKVRILRVPKGTMPASKIEDLREQLAVFEQATFTVAGADFPKAGKGQQPSPLEPSRQSAEDLEAMIRTSRRTQTHQFKPKQRGR